jgi:hypothetical protein
MMPLPLSRAVCATSRPTGERRAWDVLCGSTQQVQRKWAATPLALRIPLVAATVLALFAATNLVYQIVRKPTELFFVVGSAFEKAPAETWAAYGPLFRQYSTATITPELLAALAQVEGAGNPFARTYWRWRLSWDPFSIYRPASSAVGMYQMTDAAFVDAREACVRYRATAVDGCRFSRLYSRVLPSHAIRLAAMFLDSKVAAVLTRQNGRVTPRQTQDLAAIIHLCGPGLARAFVHRGFHLLPGQRCGAHDAARYLAAVNAMQRRFREFAR